MKIDLSIDQLTFDFMLEYINNHFLTKFRIVEEKSLFRAVFLNYDLIILTLYQYDILAKFLVRDKKHEAI